MEAAEPRRLPDHVAIHRLQQILARRIGRQIQLGIQSIELEHVVMDRPRTGARPEIGAWPSTPGRNARAVPRAIRQIAGPESFRQSLGRSRNIERRPMKSVDCGFHRRILDIVKDHRIGLATFRRGGWIRAQAPVKLERGRLVLAASGIFHGHLSTVGPRRRRYRKHQARRRRTAFPRSSRRRLRR